MTNTSSPFICTHYQYNTAKSTRRQILIQSRSREVQDTPPTVLPWGPIAHTLILLVLVSNGMGLQTAVPGTIQTSAISILWPYGYPLIWKLTIITAMPSPTAPITFNFELKTSSMASGQDWKETVFIGVWYLQFVSACLRISWAACIHPRLWVDSWRYQFEAPRTTNYHCNKKKFKNSHFPKDR